MALVEYNPAKAAANMSEHKSLKTLDYQPEGVLTAKRMKTLKTIYDWYSKQQLHLGAKPTFERL